MRSAPDVSVIVPFLNAGPFLADAVDSVREQTMQDWELILVDDGSNDTSTAIAAATAAEDQRIRLLGPSQDGRHGAAAARNRGFEAARGKFIAFLDSDDRLEPIMLERTIGSARSHSDAAAVFGRTHWWHPGAEASDWIEFPFGRTDRMHTPPQLLVRVLLLQGGHVPCVGAFLIRREALELTGGFEERLALYEDQALWAKLFLRFPVVSIPVCLLHYRQHPASTSSKAEAAGLYARGSPHPARLEFLDWLEAEVARSGLGTAAIGRALRIARSPYGENSAAEVLDRALLKIGRRFARVRGKWYRMFV